MTEYRSARDAKKLGRSARPGDRLYTVHKLATGLPIAKEMYSEHVVGKSRGVSGGAMLAGPGCTSVEQLVLSSGTVYDRPPHGMRNLADPLPQVGEPIPGGSDGWRHLSSSEIDSLEKDVRRAREERGVKHRWF